MSNRWLESRRRMIGEDLAPLVDSKTYKSIGPSALIHQMSSAIASPVLTGARMIRRVWNNVWERPVTQVPATAHDWRADLRRHGKTEADVQVIFRAEQRNARMAAFAMLALWAACASMVAQHYLSDQQGLIIVVTVTLWLFTHMLRAAHRCWVIRNRTTTAPFSTFVRSWEWLP